MMAMDTKHPLEQFLCVSYPSKQGHAELCGTPTAYLPDSFSRSLLCEKCQNTSLGDFASPLHFLSWCLLGGL